MLLFGRYKGVQNEQTRKTAFSDYGSVFFFGQHCFWELSMCLKSTFRMPHFFGMITVQWSGYGCAAAWPVFSAAGWLIKDRLKSRLSQKSFDLLEIETGILLLIVVLLLNCLYKYGNYWEGQLWNIVIATAEQHLQLDALITAVWVLLLVICGIVVLLKLASGMDWIRIRICENNDINHRIK